MEDIIKILKGSIYQIDNVASNEETIVLRLPLMTEEEMDNFRTALSKSTNTRWNFYYKYAKGKSIQKKWVCHLSSYRKTPSSKRNTDCPAKLDIRVKDLTPISVERDVFLQHDPPLRTVVSISLKHSHSTDTAAALKLMKVSPEVQLKFFTYFEDGITPGEAKSLHEDELFSFQKCEDLADASKNPTIRQVYYLHNLWRENQFGPSENPLIKLREKIEGYEKEGTSVKLADGDSWAIAIVTNVMKRAQELPTAKELIFVDCSCSCENTASTVTVMLTLSKSGALPLAVLIHRNQTADNYIQAFKLLKDNFECFGEGNNPIFMTDDSTAEKNALREIWPNRKQLLCHFHVAQAEWRWLFSQQGIPVNERPRLMKLFQAVMYAANETALNNAVKDIYKEVNYPSFVYRFSQYFERKMEWVSFFRQHLIIRGCNTNNYAEASIRILKDVVLCRTKAYNVVAFVHFIAKIYNLYLIKKLLRVAYGRESKAYLLYSSLTSRLDNYTLEDVIEVEENVFLLQSVKKNESYTVDVKIGVCSCYSGRTGALCKHQCFLYQHQKVALPNMLPVNSIERYMLGRLALGNECPPYKFFLDLKPEETWSVIGVENEVIPSKMNIDQNIVTSEISGENSCPVNGENASKENVLIKEFSRVGNLLKNVSTDLENDLIQTFKKIQTPEDLKKLTGLKSINRRRKIRVQPTSISRRREGLTKRNSRVPSGRPSRLNDKKAKRRRCLKENVMLNVNNGK